VWDVLLIVQKLLKCSCCEQNFKQQVITKCMHSELFPLPFVSKQGLTVSFLQGVSGQPDRFSSAKVSCMRDWIRQGGRTDFILAVDMIMSMQSPLSTHSLHLDKSARI
jgi:hypothetical protein